jgi:hypothetical protein
MGKTVTVGKWDDPNDKFPPFVEGVKYLMKAVESPKEIETDNYQKTGKEKKFMWKLECVDPQQPNYLGKTNMLFTQAVPTTDTRNKLTQLLAVTIATGMVQENTAYDLDQVIGQQIYCEFKQGKEREDGRRYENITLMERSGSFASNAPLPPGGSDTPLPPGWQKSWNAQYNKFQYLNPTTNAWQWEEPPVQQAPPPQAAPPAQPPAEAPLPAGWKKEWNTQYNKNQYFNPTTNAWQWEEPPVQQAAPPQAAPPAQPPAPTMQPGQSAPPPQQAGPLPPAQTPPPAQTAPPPATAPGTPPQAFSFPNFPGTPQA